MLRLALACLVLGLIVAVPAANAASTTQILRDCADDGVLQGDYTPAELRKARQNIPTDTDQYTDCRDVIARAAAARRGRSGSGGSGGGRRRRAGGGRRRQPAAGEPEHARGRGASTRRPAPAAPARSTSAAGRSSRAAPASRRRVRNEPPAAA